MNEDQLYLLDRLESIRNYTIFAEKAIKNKEYHSPEGHMYMIKEQIREFLKKVKTLQPPL